MADLQSLLSQSVTQSLGLGDILAKRQQEAVQRGALEAGQGRVLAEQELAKGRERRGLFETIGALGGALSSQLTGGGAQQQAQMAKFGQTLGGELSGARQQQGTTPGGMALTGVLSAQAEQEQLQQQQEQQRTQQRAQQAQKQQEADEKRKLLERREARAEQELQLKMRKQKQDEEFRRQQQEAKRLADEQKAAIQAQKISAEEKKKQTDLIDDRFKVETVESQLNNVVTNIDNILEDEETLRSAVGEPTALIRRLTPGSKARGIIADIESVVANSAFQTLQAMRDASKTGGALGQVSERELALLEAAIANVSDYNVPDEVFIKNLKRLRDNFESTIERNRSKFESLHGTPYEPSNQNMNGEDQRSTEIQKKATPVARTSDGMVRLSDGSTITPEEADRRFGR